MPRRTTTKNLRKRLHALEQAQAERSSAPVVLPPSPTSQWLRKSSAQMANMPLPSTSTDMAHPIFPSQIPLLEPYRWPETHGAYNRGRLFSGYGSGISFELLRLAVKRCLLIQAIHQVCHHDILQLSKQARTPEVLGWRVQHKAEDDETVDTDTPEIRKRCSGAEEFLECPHPMYEPDFRNFLSKVMDDYLTLNRVVIELMRDSRGRVRQFRAVDAATILPTYRLRQRFLGSQTEFGRQPLAWEVAARVMEQETGFPILDSEYVCVIRGQLVGTFASGELLVWEDMPVTDVRVIFPPSYVEKALEGIISWIYAFQYNRLYFSQGNPIEIILGISGDIQDDSFVALQEQLRENFSGIKGAWRVPLVQLPVDGQLSVLHMKQNHREMQFDEWMSTLASLVCGIYRLTPQRLNLHARDQENRGGMRQAQQHEMIEESKEESFQVHSAFLAQRLTHLVKLVDPDLEFVWTGLDIENRDDEIKVEVQEVTHYKTPNEMRRKHGDEPLEGAWADLPLNPLIFQAEGLAMGGKGAGMGGEGEQDAALKPQPGGDGARNGTAAGAAFRG